MTIRFCAVAAILASIASCSSKNEAPPLCQGARDREACFTDHYLGSAGDSSLSACANDTKLDVSGRKKLVFHFARSVGDLAVEQEARALQRYFSAYDLTFFTDSAATSVEFDYALEGDSNAVTARAKQQGIDTNDQAAMQKLAGEVISKNLRELVLAQPRNANEVHVVVLPQILSPSLAKELDLKGGTIVGLGLSPTLLRDAAADDPNKNLFDLFALPEDFTPVLFIGHSDITRIPRPSIAEMVAAHELGHALGLQHTTEPTNLMFPRLDASTNCRLVLSDDQVDALEKMLLAAEAAPPHVDGVFVMRDLARQLAERARAPR